MLPPAVKVNSFPCVTPVPATLQILSCPSSGVGVVVTVEAAEAVVVRVAPIIANIINRINAFFIFAFPRQIK